jgi:hypothetical protein
LWRKAFTTNLWSECWLKSAKWFVVDKVKKKFIQKLNRDLW